MTPIAIAVSILLSMQPAPAPTNATQAQASSASSTPVLDRVIPEQRKLVEKEAQAFRRFPDGKLWTDRPRRNLIDNVSTTVELADAFKDIKPWYCPESNEDADSDEQIYKRIESDRLVALLIERHCTMLEHASVIEVSKDGLLLSVTDHDPANSIIFLTGFPLASTAVDEQVFEVLTVRLSGRYQYQSRSGTRTIRKYEWVKIDPRIEHASSPVSPEELATALLKGEIKGIPVWLPTQVLIKPSETIGGGGNIKTWSRSTHENFTQPIYKCVIELGLVQIKFWNGPSSASKTNAADPR